MPGKAEIKEQPQLGTFFQKNVLIIQQNIQIHLNQNVPKFQDSLSSSNIYTNQYKYYSDFKPH